MRTYLVTGGAGFIGANFVKYLLERYDNDVDIIVLDALTYAGSLKTISAEIERDNVTFVRGDIRDTALVTRLMSEHDVDYVVNFAAESHVDRSIDNPRIFIETNVLGTQTMLECARRAWRRSDGTWPEGKRYLQISTDEVYGALTRDYDTPVELLIEPAKREALLLAMNRKDMPKTFGDKYFTEETPLSPHSPYSASKAAADMLVIAYADTYGMPVNITRCSNNYGPYHFPEKLIPLMIKNVREERPLPVYGAGLNVRDWLYVRDHCRAIDTVLRKGTPGRIYNVGGFNEQQNIDIVRMIVDEVAALSHTTPRTDLITYVGDRPGHDMRYAIDPTRIVEELGWVPETPFSTGIKQTIRWFVENTEWVDSVTSGDYQQYYEQMYSNR